jgi:primosomal protein N' (replication factor Y)
MLRQDEPRPRPPAQRRLGPLDYRVPHGIRVAPGSIVLAPLGPAADDRGGLEEDRLEAESVGDNRLRPLLHAYELPPLPAPLRRLIEWTADYYLAPQASVLRMALASASALDGGRTVTEYRATGLVPERLTPQRAQALERIGERQGLVRELALAADVSDGVIRGLCKAGAIEAVQVSIDDPYPLPDSAFAPPSLEDAQREARAIFAGAVREPTSRPSCSTASPARARPKSISKPSPSASQGPADADPAPEIALTEPFLKRFAARFGCEPVAWHSGLRQSQRRRAWRRIATGEAKVVVGARSSCSCPTRTRPDHRRRSA